MSQQPLNQDFAPQHITLDAHGLSIQWDDAPTRLEAVHLRQQCRCAACKQLASQGSTVVAAPNLKLVDVSPVGSYGVQLHFSDGHARGIYPWSLLRSLAHT